MLKRNFILGDSWLYYKIYSGPKTLDRILTELINPVSKSLLEQNIIDKWFFIRYNDPKPHLRVRFHCKDTDNLQKIIKELTPHFTQFMDMEFISNIQIDTYQREIERYGENSMELCEDIFYHDSVMMADFLDMIEDGEGDELRWLFGLKAADAFLNAFHLSIEAKVDLLMNLKTAFGEEFGMNRHLKQQLDNKYRAQRKMIEEFLKSDDTFEYPEIIEVINKKNINSRGAIDSILGLYERNELMVPVNALLSSHIHMLMNRLFRSKMRLHEMVLYDFLFRYYDSVKARTKKSIVESY